MNFSFAKAFFLLLATALFIACKKDKCTIPNAIPEYCHRIDIDPNYYEPVCGCDGKTYNSSIMAECSAGIMEYTKGECP